MGLLMSHSNEELSTLFDLSSIDEPLSPPSVTMESHSEKNLAFVSFIHQPTTGDRCIRVVMF